MIHEENRWIVSKNYRIRSVTVLPRIFHNSGKVDAREVDGVVHPRMHQRMYLRVPCEGGEARRRGVKGWRAWLDAINKTTPAILAVGGERSCLRKVVSAVVEVAAEVVRMRKGYIVGGCIDSAKPHRSLRRPPSSSLLLALRDSISPLAISLKVPWPLELRRRLHSWHAAT